MVKYFCDRCGREIEDGIRYEVRGYQYIGVKFNFSGDVFALDKTLCEDCYDEVLAVIGGDESE